jgi:hypothetical protein
MFVEFNSLNLVLFIFLFGAAHYDLVEIFDGFRRIIDRNWLRDSLPIHCCYIFSWNFDALWKKHRARFYPNCTRNNRITYGDTNNMHEKILNADWLRVVQFFRNTVPQNEMQCKFLNFLNFLFFKFLNFEMWLTHVPLGSFSTRLCFARVHLIQSFATKLANFTGLYFPHFTTIRNQTLQLYSFWDALSSYGAIMVPCLDQDFVYSWNHPLSYRVQLPQDNSRTHLKHFVLSNEIPKILT